MRCPFCRQDHDKPQLLFSIFVVCCCLAESVSASMPEPGIKSVRVGIENTYKNGLWTPITVEFTVPFWTDTTGRLAIRCSDSDGTPIT